MYIYTHIEYAGTECRDWAGGQAAGGPRASRGSGPRRTWRRAGGRTGGRALINVSNGHMLIYI